MSPSLMPRTRPSCDSPVVAGWTLQPVMLRLDALLQSGTVDPRNVVVPGAEFTVFDTETASPVDVKGIAASVDPGVLDTDVFP